jgi:hypothetical protein
MGASSATAAGVMVRGVVVAGATAAEVVVVMVIMVRGVPRGLRVLVATLVVVVCDTRGGRGVQVRWPAVCGGVWWW